ncbi:hypothetical protein [Novosphingobium album (ex Liu et al. 2023)]|uniref:Multidrug ABC transporter ATPase n=1 Tax=Novosphingobium album (ex Liu et al. 2023) TaxID=3031130 RepID=A0ABT5WSN0_9SPHN|nr:hypothetical protein [Novosphingobium album (ex Liu et al. 2023)]MDE8653049.1 hypothetical protein [Novosphingobium album (ex Liu et al. 2023)]
MRSFFGAALLGCGLLIAALSGLCTLLIAGGSLIDRSTADAREFFSLLPAVLLIGGVPFLIGLGMFFLGRSLIRSADKAAVKEPEADVFD